MSKLATVCGILFLLLFANFGLAQDRIIAVVNDDVITQKDLDDFINFMRMQLSQQLAGQELENKIQSMKLDLVDKLTEDRLILQEAKKVLAEAKKNKDVLIISRLDVEPNRIKAKINEIRGRYPSDTEFQKALSQQGLTQADIELKLTEQLLMHNIIELKVKSKIVISPAEVTDFYQKNLVRFVTNELREVTVVTIDNQKLADDVYGDLKSGLDFDSVVNKYSLSTSKLSAQKNKELRKDVEEAIFKLNIRGVTPPIKINNSFYIFRLDNILMPRQENLSEVQESIHAYLFETKMQEGLANWLDELKKKSYVRILPK